MKISVIVPVFNECRALPTLFAELTEVCSALPYQYELIAVDDGSSDGSREELKKLAKDKHVKVILFKANYGQTAAIQAGFNHATGDVLIPIDSDLENDPHDIPKLLEKFEEGYDVVSGWRKSRWSDKPLSRRLPSAVANWMIASLTHVPLHDFGCTLKAYRTDVIRNVRLYGEMHRFIPAYASWQGARVTEIPVRHRPRPYGKSHYGIWRTFRVLLDLLLVVFLYRYMNRPIHFFGGLGFISLFIGFLAGVVAIVFKLLSYKDFVATPLPVFSALFIIVGVQLIALGVVAEILMRVYYESQGKDTYLIATSINI